MKLHRNAKLSVKGRELLVDRIEQAGWSPGDRECGGSVRMKALVGNRQTRSEIWKLAVAVAGGNAWCESGTTPLETPNCAAGP